MLFLVSWMRMPPRVSTDPYAKPGALTPPGAQPIIRVTALEKYYGKNHVLRGVNLEVYPSETVCLIGRSGSGKSTLLRCINFLEEPSVGSVEVDGVDVACSPFKSRPTDQVEMVRQIRIRGPVETVMAQEADEYFATRPRTAQLGAWASRQSRALESRLAFEKAIAVQTAKHALGSVPRPPYWSGYRVVPMRMEFWHDRPFRLHDRIEFRRDTPDMAWTKTRMYP